MTGKQKNPNPKPRVTNPISLQKKTAEEKKAFAASQFKPKWHNHPIKHIVLKWIEDGCSANKLVEKLCLQAVEDGVPVEEYSLSLPTCIKIRRRHLQTIGALKETESKSTLQTMLKNEFGGVEEVLRQTIKDCTEKKKDPTISPKDWQYFDQQQQSAIQLINSLRSEGKSGEDIAIVISRIFSQFFRQLSPTAQGPKIVPTGKDDIVGPKEDEAI